MPDTRHRGHNKRRLIHARPLTRAPHILLALTLLSLTAACQTTPSLSALSSSSLSVLSSLPPLPSSCTLSTRRLAKMRKQNYTAREIAKYILRLRYRYSRERRRANLCRAFVKDVWRRDKRAKRAKRANHAGL